jgi:hypothetical protein
MARSSSRAHLTSAIVGLGSVEQTPPSPPTPGAARRNRRPFSSGSVFSSGVPDATPRGPRLQNRVQQPLAGEHSYHTEWFVEEPQRSTGNHRAAVFVLISRTTPNHAVNGISRSANASKRAALQKNGARLRRPRVALS